MASPKTFSKTQIVLHWLIVLMVLFQYVAHDSIVQLWQGRMRGTIPNEPTPDLHVAFGIVIFLLMIWRVWLLVRHGVPEASEEEPAWGRILAKAVQGLIYLILFALPLSGATAWFFGVGPAGVVHGLITKVLLALIAFHIAGALAQQFWFRSNTLMRMLGRA